MKFDIKKYKESNKQLNSMFEKMRKFDIKNSDDKNNIDMKYNKK